MVKLKIEKKGEEKSESKEDKKKKLIPTLNLKTEHEIAMDFATKVYKVLGDPIKSIVLFGSTVKGDEVARSDIDIIVIIDDVSINWDIELAAWYREELAKIVEANPYAKELHINTVRLSTWWDDLLRGDPVIINVLRYGEPLIDFAGFFLPQKYLLLNGKIKGTPEAIYSCLQRAPAHLARSKSAELSSIEGVYWCMVDSAHAALISSKVLPPSPEHIGADLTETFVNKGRLKQKYVDWYKEILVLHKRIVHGEIYDIKGALIDEIQKRAEEFLSEMIRLVKENISTE